MAHCGAGAAPVAPPPYAGAYQPRGVDEVGLWHEMDEQERRLTASNLVINDEKLTAYVKKVLCDTVGADRCNAVRIYVMREPTFNASMAANGTMRVLSGLFLRVHDEAELGAVLGHEFGHFEGRHTLEHFRSARQGSDLLAWVGVLASMAPTYSVRQSYQSLQLSVYGDLYRFGRNQEREADALGVGYLNASQLPPQAASSVWRNVMAELEVSAQVKGLKKPNFQSIAFTASHPPEAERAATLANLARSDASGRDGGAERYRAALAPWLPLFLEDQIKLNDFGASDYLIQSLAEQGWSAPLWFARGELYRGRGAPRDLVQAAPDRRARGAARLSLPETECVGRDDDPHDAPHGRYEELTQIGTRLAAAVATASLLSLAVPAGAHKLHVKGVATTVAQSTLTVTPARDWNQLGMRIGKNVETWTLDGEQLNDVTFYGGIAAGMPLVREKSKKREPLPKFTAQTLLVEVPELLERTYRSYKDIGAFTLTSTDPTAFLGGEGVRFTYEYRDADELSRKGEARAMIRQGKLYMITFDAPRLSYFDKAVGDFHALADSAVMR
jgi:Zn-dependent protease with chaperone function